MLGSTYEGRGSLHLTNHANRGSPHPDPQLRGDRGWPFVVAAIAVGVALHLNYWLWDADGLVLGLPANLFYHVVWTLALAGFMWALVRWRWPGYLDAEDPE